MRISLPHFTILAFLSISTVFSHPSPSHNVFHIDSTVTNATSSIQFTYPGTGFDGPKVRPVNTTTFDWWYFDAVSKDLPSGDLSSVAIVFYDASFEGFELLDHKPTKLQCSITGTFSNGSIFGQDVYPAEATVVTVGDSSGGKWGANTGWSSSPDMKYWEIRFEDEAVGIKGCMKLESIAPAHLPCGAPKAGDTEMLIPNIGWANAVPDGNAVVDFEIAGEKLKYEGVGYHDKNWGATPFFTNVNSWYWGHARLGPYSIVWFDALDIAGKEHYSSYVAKDGQIVDGSCAKGAVKARPWGGEDKYPPPHNKKVPKGFEVVFPNVEGKEFRVNVTTAEVVLPAKSFYDRFIGVVEGGFAGESETWSGVAEYEEFKPA